MATARSKKALDRARSLHQKGEFTEAERLCESVLRRDAGDVDALQLLGLLNAQRGHLEEARQHFDRALGLNPGRAELHYLRAEVASALGLREQALDGYHQSLALRPDSFEVLVNMGDLLLQLGRAKDALGLLDRAARIRPDDAAVLNNRGNALQALKRHEDALQCFDRLLAKLPGHADVLNNRASALLRLGRFAEAEADCRTALAQRADHSPALLNLARAQAGQGLPSEALKCFEAALRLNPRDFHAWYERAMFLAGLLRYRDARQSLEQALRLAPDAADAWSDLGSVLVHLGEYEPALAAYDRAVARQPDNAQAWNNRGLALQLLSRHEEALSSFENALRLDPAIPSLQLDPRTPYVQGRLAWLAMSVCDWRAHRASAEGIVAGVRAGERTVEPVEFLYFSDSARDQLACAQVYARDRHPRQSSPLWNGERYRHERIRVAYVSADFREHPAAYLLKGLFEKHDRTRIEPYGISLGPEEHAGIALHIEAAFDHFVHARGFNDSEVAGLLRRHEIDIAVDLMGFTGYSRTGIFAMQPCPVQVHYLGFPATMGADYVDYIIADRFVVPPGRETDYAEEVVRLPDTFQANESFRSTAARTPARAELGLPERGTVFCSFSKSAKITPAMFGVWMEILREVRDGVLWLWGGNASLQASLQREALERGIGASRLVIAPGVPYADHLARLRCADVGLDTLPFNGGATVSDALWAGVPVVTCPGDAFAARMAGSLLHAVGMPELVTTSLEDYKTLAIRLGNEPQLLAQTKDKLARNRATHPLFDADRFRRHIEAAYEIMWQRSQRGEPPASFSVEAIAEAHDAGR
jgi:predicted O-linked N-acetylglucosamine transferase (SPINDLY family)